MDTPDSAIPEHTTEEDDIEITDLEMPVSADEKKKISGLRYYVLLLQRPLSRRKFRLLTTLSILLLLALVIFTNTQGELAMLGNARDTVTSFLVQRHLIASNVPPGPISIAPSAVISPQKDGMVCINDVSWSPDSRYVVLLGNQQGCAVGGSASPGILTIHDASSGKRVRSVLLNGLVMQAFHNQYGKIHTEGVMYYHFVLWSSDKHHLAILFYAVFFHEPQVPGFDGVLLLDAGGGTPTVFLHEDSNTSPSYLVWDMQQGTEYIAPSVISGSSQNPGFTIPPSVFYRWGNGGEMNELQAVQNNKGSGLSNNEIGNPDGGKSFTFWQPGEVDVTTHNGNGSFASGVATWSTSFAAWSPDGRYIVDNLLVDGRFIVPGRPNPDQQTLNALSMDLLPPLAVRDKGLQSILEMLFSTPASSYVGLVGASISWRFDGRLLASYGAGDIYDTRVTIYRCTDGVQVATLLPSPPGSSQMGGRIILRWSDDGSRVLLFNISLATVTIWNVPTTL